MENIKKSMKEFAEANKKHVLLTLTPSKAKKVVEYIELLERENKALIQDNELKCEKNEVLDKALEVLSKYIVHMDCQCAFPELDDVCKEPSINDNCIGCWKKWALEEARKELYDAKEK